MEATFSKARVIEQTVTVIALGGEIKLKRNSYGQSNGCSYINVTQENINFGLVNGHHKYC